MCLFIFAFLVLVIGYPNEIFFGPLRAKFTYEKHLLPNGSPKTDCNVTGWWYDIPVNVSTRYNTLHVTGTILFNGWNDTSNLQQIEITYPEEYPIIGLCWIGPSWTVYIGTAER